MKRALLMSAVMGGLLCGCQTTVQQEWKDPGYAGPASGSVFVLCLPQDSEERTCEDEFVAQLKEEGVSAVPAHSVLTVPATEGAVMAKARGAGTGRVLVSRFLSVKKEVWERPLERWSMFEGDWGDLRGDYEYVEHFYKVFATTLYDATTGKKIWSAVSETSQHPSEKKTVALYAKAMIKKLQRQKLLGR